MASRTSRRTKPAARGSAPRARSGRDGLAGSADGAARLWAPWRMTYIGKADAPGGCLFCRVRDAGEDRRDLVIARRPNALLMLNRFPYNPAHLMVAVARHTGAISDLTPAERADWLDLCALAERVLAAEYRPHGLNYGANAGRVAGAGFPDHLHLHLVPRWNGDTNFMPLVAGTKVLPESLSRTWARLRRAARSQPQPVAAAAGRLRAAGPASRKVRRGARP